MNFLFVLNGGTGNRGCEAIMLSTYDLLRGSIPDASFINCSFMDPRVGGTSCLKLPRLRHAPHPEPGSVASIRWQIAKRLQGHTHNFQRFLPWADYVLSLGGDNYSLDYGSAHAYFAANEVILNAGKKLVLWGCSVGPFDRDPDLEQYAAVHLKKVYKIVARESRTQAYLAKLGVVDNVVLLPDPAFSLRPEPVRLSDDLEELLNAGALGVNLSPLLARYRQEPERWLDQATDWIRTLAQSLAVPIILIPHVMQPGNDDAEFLGTIADRLAWEKTPVRLLPAYDLSSRQLKHVISRLRAFIGARTHATIAALSSGVPTLSIGYSVKARGINEDIFGNLEWLASHDTLTSAELTKRARILLDQREKVIAHLQLVNPTYRMGHESLTKLFR